MKKILILIILFTVSMSVWGQNEAELNGIWINHDEQIFFVFYDNLCFLGEVIYGQYGVIDETFNFKFNKNAKTLELSYEGEGERFGASLNGNKLVITIDDESIDLFRDTDSPAPTAIAGLWRGPQPWLFLFINEHVFIIDEDGDADCGTYRFSNNRGSFETDGYGWEVNFSVRGNTLTASGDVSGTFTRAR